MDQVLEQSRGEQQATLAPLNIIRTETVLSKLPLHNLAKRGRVNIHITKKNDQGEVDLYWRVSPNPDFGEPRQLAYKLDTIVINRKIEEAGRPLPRIVKIGSIKELHKELGSEKGELKKALQQNATAAITAKLNYKDRDGSEKHLEAVFTRYSVVFTGKKLPDGTKADAVHIILNEPYWQVLSDAPYRPLDYDYLKVLTPASQRFYEIISYRIFAAIKYKHPYAKLPYSEYCTFSAQQRYFDYDHFKKQMYKVHKPHKKSGYLAKVTYEATTDGEGNPDWIMLYIPGLKAEAEYKRFNCKQAAIGEPPIETPPGPTAPEARQESRREGNGHDPAPRPLQKDSIETQAVELVVHFYSLFHGNKALEPRPKELDQATSLIASHGMDQARFIVDFAHRAATETNYRPQTFGGIVHYATNALAAYDRHKQAEERQAKEEAAARDRERRDAEERQRGEDLLAQLSPAERERLFAEARAEVLEENSLVRQHPDGGIAQALIRGTVFKKLKGHKV